MTVEERKIVSVLFADIRGSLRHVAGRDPEEVSEILDPIVETMAAGARRHGGTIIQVRGDGLYAVFGAPLSQEDHARRACEAALAIRRELRTRSERGYGPAHGDVAVRMGIHSGEVLFRVSHAAGSERLLEVTGDTVFVAARLEQTAQPGGIQISMATHRLAGRSMMVRSLGPRRLKGLTAAMETLALVDSSPLTQLPDRFTARTPLVDRVSERALLFAASSGVANGQGQTVAISGEPGCGKSRLLQEAAEKARERGFLVLEASCTADGSQASYLPFRMLCRQIIQLERGDDHVVDALRAVLGRAGSRRPEDVDELALAIGALVDPRIAGAGAWLALGPDKRRNTIVAALAAIVGALGHHGPTMLVIEDLHWADQQTLRALDFILGAMPPRILMLVSFREEFSMKWLDADRQIPLIALQPLEPVFGCELVAALLGLQHTEGRFVQFISDRAAGNPFFAEELVADLAEQGLVAEAGAAYDKDRLPPSHGLPITVRAVLATRLDRLAQADKELLETAAVIGKDFDLPLLAAAMNQPVNIVEAVLLRLIHSRFLIRLDNCGYRFQHALTREASYLGMAKSRRGKLHRSVLDALIGNHAAASHEFAETCLQHALGAQMWLPAARYARQAAANSMALSANRQAQSFLQQGLRALESVPHSRERDELAADILLEMRDPLNRLGRLPEVVERLRAADPITTRLNDQRRSGQLDIHLSHVLWLTGKHGAAAEIAERATVQGRHWDDAALSVRAGFQLGLTQMARGDLLAAARSMEATVASIRSRPAITGQYGLDEAVSAVANGYAARAYADLGEWTLAEQAATASRWLPEALQRPFNRVFSDLATAYVALAQGKHAAALEAGERAIMLCEQAEASLMLPVAYMMVGAARLDARDISQALEKLRQAVASASAMGFMFQHPTRLALLAEAELRAGNPEEALRIARRAIRLARRLGERPGEAVAMRALALALHATDARSSAQRYLRAAVALGEAMQMQPLVERCRAELAGGGW